MKALAAESRLNWRHTMRGRMGPSNCATVGTAPSPKRSASPGPDQPSDVLGATAETWTSWPSTSTSTGWVTVSATSSDSTPRIASATARAARPLQRWTPDSRVRSGDWPFVGVMVIRFHGTGVAS